VSDKRTLLEEGSFARVRSTASAFCRSAAGPGWILASAPAMSDGGEQRSLRDGHVVEPEPTIPVRQSAVEVGVDLGRLEPWREAVRGAADAVGLIELPSTRFIELSPQAKELIGPDTDIGLQLVAPDERVQAEAVTRAAAEGAIDGTEVRRHRWHRPDGSTVEVTVRARVIRVDGASLGLWVARDLSRPTDDLILGSSGDAVDWPVSDRPHAPGVVATLDDRWRIRRLASADSLSDVLGEGVAVTAITHPEDMARLLFAFAGATTQVDDVAARVRLLPEGERVAVNIAIGRVGDGSWRLVFTPVRGRETAQRGTSQRERDLEASLQRIASELQGAGVMTESEAAVDVLRVPGVSQLPERQREIVVRLVRGERVGTIASELYLSANTVRNHLSAVFRKFGVHSQQELLVLLRDEEGDEIASAT
jgi:DNA-binding CsgD family transcriptional regulator